MNVRFYIDPETRMPHIYRHSVDEDEVEDVLRKRGEDRPGIRDHSVPADRQATDGLPAAPEKEVMKKQSAFPPGWDEDRVRCVLAHYEDQTEEEAVAEDEAAVEDKTQTLM
jgi:hypothetical protein